MNSSPSQKKFCRHFDICSGCQTDVNIYFPPVWEDVLNYFNEKGILSVPFYSDSRIHWRNRAKLAVRGTSRHPVIGLFKQGSHDVVSIPFCRIHYPEINLAVESVRRMIIETGLMPYDERKGSGELRYLQFVTERSSKKVQVVFVLNFKDLSSARAKKVKALIESMGAHERENRWHSLWINLNNRSGNTIFGDEWILCSGSEFLWEKFEKISVCYGPSNFAQANLDLFEKMLFRINELLTLGAKVAEFYAGVGVIGLYLTEKSGRVCCAEINTRAELCFSHSRAVLDPSEAKKISFHTGPAQDLIAILEGSDTAIVDPPRKGLDPELLQALMESLTLKSLFYVSCGWESFKRDCDRLTKSGWKLVLAEGYLFFPGSNHIEILAKFDKIQSHFP